MVGGGWGEELLRCPEDQPEPEEDLEMDCEEEEEEEEVCGDLDDFGSEDSETCESVAKQRKVLKRPLQRAGGACRMNADME
eukprot:7256403-Alexandrium_andersonii.AAC.1